MSETTGYPGFLEPQNTSTDYAGMTFLVNQIINQLATSTLVKVVKVTNNGDVQPVGTVDVQPLVNQVDGAGSPVAHGVIHNLPYIRVQGGTNAIILDPKVGDLGLAVFCSRDISRAKRTKGQANPDSSRKYDWADGIYVGGLLNGVPQQYVQFNDTGITILSPIRIAFVAPSITFTTIGGGAADVTMTGNINVIGTLHNNSKDVGSTHTHGGVQPGGGSTSVPN